MINANTTCAVGDSGTVLMSNNGGATWSAQATGSPKDLAKVSAAPSGPTVWAVGVDGTILRGSGDTYSMAHKAVEPNAIYSNNRPGLFTTLKEALTHLITSISAGLKSLTRFGL